MAQSLRGSAKPSRTGHRRWLGFSVWLRKADAAHYAGKQAGRNGLVVADGVMARLSPCYRDPV